MTFFKWVIRSLVHYRRLHLAVVLAAATATAALTGALLTGDSVRATLKYAFDSRLGHVDGAVFARERFFTDALAQRLEEDNIETAPVLQLRGMVTKGDGSIRVNQVRVFGVDERFFRMSPSGKSPEGLRDGTVLLNSALASRLAVKKEGENEVVLRIDNPSAISRNLVLAPFKDSTISMRLPVKGIVDDNHFGRFSLEANQQESLNLFVPIIWLQRQIKRDGRSNLLLISNTTGISKDMLTGTLGREWRLEDAGVELKDLGKDTIELQSSRVFIDHSITNAAFRARPDALPILTYFVNELRSGSSSTPYSMVSAVEAKGAFKSVLPPDMQDDQIVINQWLSDDLNAKAGDELTLRYYVPGGWQSLEETERSFKICRVIPIEGAAADPGLTPDLPGISDSENCRDWDPSLPIDLDRIRDKDETYWGDHHGTPKAFITLAAGQAMWANTYGDLTAVRFQAHPSDRNALAGGIRSYIDPSSVGLSIIPVHEIGKRASRGGTDFGQLFLGLSMFLIASGIILMWLLFVFSIEGRRQQTGMLMAIGFPLKRIRKLYILEGLIIALLGSLLGTLMALVYTRLLVWGLSNAWQGAVAGMTVMYSASFSSIFTGFFSGFIIAFIAMIRILRRQLKSNAHSLISGTESSSESNMPSGKKRSRAGWVMCIISFTGGIILILGSKSLGSSAMAGAFFGAGTLLLISFMIFIRMILIRMASGAGSALSSLNSLAVRNSARRRGRSMAVAAMLACGVFMVIAVGANRKDQGEGAELRSSGTGGFTLYAESSVPVVQDLHTIKGRSAWGMDPSMLEGTSFVNLRVRDGDDASCLNLNRTREPRILGVSVEKIARLKAFSFQEIENSEYKDKPWELLEQDPGDGIIPAVGDYPTVYWGLGKKTGDILVFHNRKGEEIRLRIAGMMRSSILQGSLVISDKAMARYFPEVEGYGAWLIDTPPDRKQDISSYLTKRMAYAGLSVETAVERLELFARMEDTYLSIFLILGGLGLMLGCIGLGLVVARNLLEREGELAMMRAVGFRKSTILRMVCYEHVYLLAAGLFAGLICAVISVIPAIGAASGQFPFGLLAIMTLLIGASGIVWVVISTKITLKGNILAGLRNE